MRMRESRHRQYVEVVVAVGDNFFWDERTQYQIADKTNDDMPSRNRIRGLNPPARTLLSSLVGMFRTILRLPLLIGIRNLLPVKARLYFSRMDDSLENITVAALDESMQLLMMSNRKASLPQMREICTAARKTLS